MITYFLAILSFIMLIKKCVSATFLQEIYFQFRKLLIFFIH